MFLYIPHSYTYQLLLALSPAVHFYIIKLMQKIIADAVILINVKYLFDKDLITLT